MRSAVLSRQIRQTTKAYFTARPTLRVDIPSSWSVRDSAFSVPTMPRCLMFASNESLPLVPAGNGEWDQPVYALSDAGVALELSVLDTWQNPDKWLKPQAVHVIKAAGEWPTDPNSALKAAPALNHALSVAELQLDVAQEDGRAHRLGWYQLGHWAVLVELWAGKNADISSAGRVITSIRPS